MKSLNSIQTLCKIGKVLSKIAFIFSVIGFGGGAAGLISLIIGNDALVEIGTITIHGTMLSDMGMNAASISARLAGWMIVCVGEAVSAKLAEIYFKNELQAGTPFTLGGAKEMQRLGITVLAVSAVCSVAGAAAEGIILGFSNIENTADSNIYSNVASGIALGIVFIIVSLLCRCGAELRESEN